jgi:hypothetical protein
LGWGGLSYVASRWHTPEAKRKNPRYVLNRRVFDSQMAL